MLIKNIHCVPLDIGHFDVRLGLKGLFLQGQVEVTKKLVV